MNEFHFSPKNEQMTHVYETNNKKDNKKELVCQPAVAQHAKRARKMNSHLRSAKWMTDNEKKNKYHVFEMITFVLFCEQKKRDPLSVSNGTYFMKWHEASPLWT